MQSGATIPAETDLLCEGCGYVLTGLPEGRDGEEPRCPECGNPVTQSSPTLRAPPAWERAEGQPWGAQMTAFATTTAAVLFRPARFYRTLATRGDATRRPLRFAEIQWATTSVLLGWAAFLHATWFVMGYTVRSPLKIASGVLALAAATGMFLFLTTKLAAWLTHWEASYRGIRLPRSVVERGMYYHAAHYVPVALAAAATVTVFRALLDRGPAGALSTTTYLYVLCAEVVLAALYLFRTYWTGMRNMMYANR